MSEFDNRFNNLTFKERQNLMPYLIEANIRHVEQCKIKAVNSHRKLMDDYNEHIKSMKGSLSEYKDLKGE